MEGVTWISWPPISTGRDELPDHLVGDDARVLGPLEVGQDHHELVAALARHGVHLAHARDQPPRHVLQDEVAGVVAERVVDHLEAVEVEEQHRHVALLAARGHDRLVEAVLHEAPVGQPGERVVVRHVVDGALGVEALGDVLHQGSEADQLPGAVRERRVVPLAMDRAPDARHVGRGGLVALGRLHQVAAHGLDRGALRIGGEQQRQRLAERLVQRDSRRSPRRRGSTR